MPELRSQIPVAHPQQQAQGDAVIELVVCDRRAAVASVPADRLEILAVFSGPGKLPDGGLHVVTDVNARSDADDGIDEPVPAYGVLFAVGTDRK
jgi:hypothetical protein